MKTLKYMIVPAMAGLLFVACNNEPKGPTQAELDTQVEAKVKAATDQLKADCDSRLMQAAQVKADSVLSKMKPTTKPAQATTPAPPKQTTKTTTTKDKTTTTTKSTTVQGGGLRSQSDANKAKDKKAVEGGGLRSQSDASKAKDNKAVEGGGLRSQSDKSIEKK